MREGDTLAAEPIDVRRADVLVPQRVNRVPALLIGTDPEDVGSIRARWSCRRLVVSICFSGRDPRELRGGGGDEELSAIHGCSFHAGGDQHDEATER